MLGKSRFELALEWESEDARQEHMATLLARRPFDSHARAFAPELSCPIRVPLR